MRVNNRQPHRARVYRLGLVYSDILLPLPLDVELVDCVDFLPERRYDRGAAMTVAIAQYNRPVTFGAARDFPPAFVRAGFTASSNLQHLPLVAFLHPLT